MPSYSEFQTTKPFLQMKKLLLYIPLLLFINCSSALDSIVKEQNRPYSKEQLRNDFLMHYLGHINNTRDTVFRENGLIRSKNFTLFEFQSAVDGNYSGCFISEKKTIGFWKESYFDKLEYEECDFGNYIKYFENTADEDIEECSKRNWETKGPQIFLIESKKGKVTMKKFQYFDIEQCIMEQKMKN